MAGITEDKIIETVHTKNDGVWQSTIDDVLEVTRSVSTGMNYIGLTCLNRTEARLLIYTN